MGDWDEVVTR